MSGIDKLKLLKHHNLKFIAFAVASSPPSPFVYLGGSDFRVSRLDPSKDKLDIQEIGRHDSYVTSVAAVHPWVVSGGYDGRLRWWDAERSRLIRSLDAHDRWIRQVVASPDGKRIASVADDMTCKIHETESGKLLHQLRGHELRTPHHFPSMLYACTFSHDGKLLATGDKVGHVVIWDAQSGKQIKTLEAPGTYTWDGKQRIHSIGGIRALAFSPDGSHLALGGIGKIGNVDHLEGPARIEVFNLESGKPTHLFEKTKYKGIVNRLAYLPDGKRLLAAGGAGNGFLIFADLQANKVVREEDVKFHVHSFRLGKPGDPLVAVGHHGLATYSSVG